MLSDSLAYHLRRSSKPSNAELLSERVRPELDPALRRNRSSKLSKREILSARCSFDPDSLALFLKQRSKLSKAKEELLSEHLGPRTTQDSSKLSQRRIIQRSSTPTALQLCAGFISIVFQATFKAFQRRPFDRKAVSMYIGDWDWDWVGDIFRIMRRSQIPLRLTCRCDSHFILSVIFCLSCGGGRCLGVGCPHCCCYCSPPNVIWNIMAWEEEAALMKSRNNNNMDSNFIQLGAVSADEEKGSATRRRTAFQSSSSLTGKNTLDGTYNSSEGDGGYRSQPFSGNEEKKQTSLREQLHSFRVMSAPYFRESKEGRCLFAVMVVLSLANSAVRVTFSYLSRDFWSALSNKEEEQL